MLDMNMTACVLLTVLLAVAGVAATAWHRGWELPESISGIVYELPRHYAFLWTLWMMTVAFSIAPPLIEALPDALRFVGFLTVLLLLFVAALPLVESATVEAHYAAAITAGILSQVCVVVICPWWLLAWPLWLYSIYFKHGMLIAEVICFVTLAGALLCHYG